MMMGKKSKEATTDLIKEAEVASDNQKLKKEENTMMMTKKINIKEKSQKEMRMKIKMKKKKKNKILLLIFTINLEKEESRLMQEDNKSNKKWL